MNIQEAIKQVDKLAKHYEDIEQTGKRMLKIIDKKEEFKGLPVEIY
jgi:uncharacterized protein YaaR (DUF327 family)